MALKDVAKIKQTADMNVVNEFLEKGYEIMKIFSGKISQDGLEQVQPVYVLGLRKEEKKKEHKTEETRRLAIIDDITSVLKFHGIDILEFRGMYQEGRKDFELVVADNKDKIDGVDLIRFCYGKHKVEK